MEKKQEEEDEIKRDEGLNEDPNLGNACVISEDSKKANEIRKSVRFDLDENQSDLNDDGMIEVQVNSAITTVALVMDSSRNISGKIDDDYIHFPNSQKDIGRYMPKIEDVSDDDAQDDKIRKIDTKQEEVSEEGSKEENVNEKEPSDGKGDDTDSTENKVEGEGLVPVKGACDEANKESEIRKIETDPETRILDSELEQKNEEKKDEDEDSKEDNSEVKTDDETEDKKQKEDKKEEVTDEEKTAEDSTEPKQSENKEPVVSSETENKPDTEKVKKETPIDEDKDGSKGEIDENSKEDPKQEIGEEKDVDVETSTSDKIPEKENVDAKEIDVKCKEHKPASVER